MAILKVIIRFGNHKIIDGNIYIETNDCMILEAQQKISFRNFERNTGFPKKNFLLCYLFLFILFLVDF